MTPTQGEHAQPLRIEAAYSGDKLIGYTLATSGTEGTNRCLVWVDQAAMPGIRLGDHFVPCFGEKIEYRPIPLDAPAQPAAPQGGACAELTHEQVSRIVDVVVERSISLTQDVSGIRVAYDPNILADAIGNVLRASHGQAPAATPQADSQPAPPTWLTDPAPTPEREFAEWLNERRGFPVSAVFHEIMRKFAARAPADSVTAPAAGAVAGPTLEALHHAWMKIGADVAGLDWGAFTNAVHYAPATRAAPQPVAAVPRGEYADQLNRFLTDAGAAPTSDGWPRLERTAALHEDGTARFGKGVSARLLVEAAYRNAERTEALSVRTPEQRKDDERKRREAWDLIHGSPFFRPGAGPLPTHRCKVCGALWRYWPKRDTGHDDSWNLRSSTCGKCCDMAPMGDQIEPLTWEHLPAAPTPAAQGDAALRNALQLAVDHIDMDALSISHCKDAEAIRAALAQKEAPHGN